MLNSTNFKVLFFALLLFILGLFSAKASQESWVAGDDIDATGFLWSSISPNFDIYYCDNLFVVKKYSARTCNVVTGKYFSLFHCMTTSNNGIPHKHFEHELGESLYPTPEEVDRYWNGRFQCGPNPEKYYSGDPPPFWGVVQLGSTASTRDNSHSAAFYPSLGGIYFYWITDVGPVIADDCYEVAKGEIDNLDIIYYGSVDIWGDSTNFVNHTTLYGKYEDGGEPMEVLSWKWDYSGYYFIINPASKNTPMCIGPDASPMSYMDVGVRYWADFKPGFSGWQNAGNFSSGTTHVYRRN